MINVSRVCLHECWNSIACVCLYLLLLGFERLEGELGLPKSRAIVDCGDRGRSSEVQNRQACQPIRMLIKDQAYDEDQILQEAFRF